MHGHIQRTDRFVADEILRLQNQRAGDGDPLLLTAGKLRDIARAVRRGQTDQPQHFGRFFRLLRLCVTAADAQRLSDRVLYGESGIERGCGILKDFLHPAALCTERCFIAPVERFAAEQHLSGRRRQKAERRIGEGRLAAAAFADKSESLTFTDRQRHVGHRLHIPPFGKKRRFLQWEMHMKMIRLQQDLFIHHRHLPQKNNVPNVRLRRHATAASAFRIAASLPCSAGRNSSRRACRRGSAASRGSA